MGCADSVFFLTGQLSRAFAGSSSPFTCFFSFLLKDQSFCKLAVPPWILRDSTSFALNGAASFCFVDGR